MGPGARRVVVSRRRRDNKGQGVTSPDSRFRRRSHRDQRRRGDAGRVPREHPRPSQRGGLASPV
jgi:hypothetical protein